MCRARIEPLDQTDVEDAKKRWLPHLLEKSDIKADEYDQECPVVGRWMKSAKWCILGDQTSCRRFSNIARLNHIIYSIEQ